MSESSTPQPESTATPVVIEQAQSASSSQSQSSQGNKQKQRDYMMSSEARALEIGKRFHIDALIAGKSEQDLAERTAERQRYELQRRQANLENILKLCYGQCRNEASQEPDSDWLHHFFTMAQQVHGTSMQQLWARILKHEMIQPGHFSVKSLQVLLNMTQREAQLFQRACALSCSFGGDHSKKLLTGIKSGAGIKQWFKPEAPQLISLGQYQLPYSSLLVLMELGLILSTELESGTVAMQPPLVLQYQQHSYQLTPRQKGTRLLYYRFTPIGNELAKLLGNKTQQNYQQDLLDILAQRFFVDSSVNGGQVNTQV
ncbi:hypothetical protein VST7929_00364 [Vibrio stylophorae]|uniref:TIGR03899 family protein n=1 Tax=Vibrio stylophorae TaxID=659351 RepID=A0ABM8ZRL6_9VIBR|nr:TIGR03899 family protein [Vibrio stylophorae]CAH0532534.1 hypothetical protein VST7929_00364 [Vibrio stylophorae]